MKRHSRRPTGRVPDRSGQRGFALVVGLIMLIIITVVIVGAHSLSMSNAKAVGNVQLREEAVAAANQAIERVISTPFTNATGTQTFTVDINKDGVDEYTVIVARPTCVRAMKASSAKPSDVELGPEMSSGVDWLTDWDLDSSVTHANTGTSVRIHQGVRVMLNQTQKDTVCP